MADPNVRHMKWWGWGHEDVSFSDADKPKLWPTWKVNWVRRSAVRSRRLNSRR